MSASGKSLEKKRKRAAATLRKYDFVMKPHVIRNDLYAQIAVIMPFHPALNQTQHCLNINTFPSHAG